MNNKPQDSLNISSADFVFDLTREKIDPRASIQNQTLDDLQYSMDEPSQNYILTQLKKQQEQVAKQKAFNVSAPMSLNREQQKKNSRKAIFEKYKQNVQSKKDVMQLFDDVLRGKTTIADGAVLTIDSRKNQMIHSNNYQEVQAIPQHKMNPPPNLIKKNSFQSSPKEQLNNQIKTSNISLGGSFSINDGFSVILGTNNNQFAHSRQSQQIAQLLDADIFGSFQNDDKSLIHIDVNDNQNSLNILDDIRISAIGLRNKQSKNEDINAILGINLANSQQINVFAKTQQQTNFQKMKQDASPFVIQPTKTLQVIENVQKIPQKLVVQQQIDQRVIPQQKQIINNPTPVKFFGLPHNRKQQEPSFQKPASATDIDNVRPTSSQNINIVFPPQTQNQFQPQAQKHIKQFEINSGSNSQLSINSNFQNKNSSNSFLMMGSGSLNNALGQLSQHIFNEAVLQNRMPQLLQQAWRLNSISINIKSSTLALDSIRHKQILRSLIFQQLMAAQTLQKFRDELQVRQTKQKSMYSAFAMEAYLQGQWYQTNKVRNNQIIQPKQPHPKRPIDFNMIKDTLKNSVQVLRYFQNFIEHFKIEATEDFKKKYIDFRTSLYEIFNNLKKISQDLYMKSITLHLPLHYYKFYQFLKNTDFLNPSTLSIQELRKKIQQRQKIQLQIQYFKNQHDPLACSKIAKDIDNKARNELRQLKSAYHNSKTSQYKQ